MLIFRQKPNCQQIWRSQSNRIVPWAVIGFKQFEGLFAYHPELLGGFFSRGIMAIKLYRIPQSRSARCLWMPEELSAPYENVAVHFVGDAQKPEFLKINPNGRIPRSTMMVSCCSRPLSGFTIAQVRPPQIPVARVTGRLVALDSTVDLGDNRGRTADREDAHERLFLPEAQRVKAEAIQGECRCTRRSVCSECVAQRSARSSSTVRPTSGAGPSDAPSAPPSRVCSRCAKRSRRATGEAI
jgi:hypothetical protein